MEISRRLAQSQPLATAALHGRVDAMKARGEDVIDFSIAISHLPPPAAVLAAAHEALRGPALPYTTVAGDATIRARLAACVADVNRIDATPAEILVANGAKQALYQALYAMTDPGDAVIIFKPYWPAYVATSRLLGLEPVLVDLPATITAAVLDQLPPAKVLILNNPHNPTGTVLTGAERDCIAAWLRKTGTRAIVDESYERLVFDGAHASLAARPDWRALGVVTLFSASQSYAMMGWRAGFAVAPAPLVAAMEALQGPITAAAPMLTQLALAAAFESDGSHRPHQSQHAHESQHAHQSHQSYELHQSHQPHQPRSMLADYRARRDLVLDLMANLPWLTVKRPASGPYLWLDASKLGLDSHVMAERLLAEHGVAVMAGDALGGPGHLRIGYISDDVATLRRGVSAIIAFGNACHGGR